MSGKGDAARPGVCCDVAVNVHHGHLPQFVLRVGGQQPGQRRLRRFARLHQSKTERPVGDVDERLGRNRADACFQPRHRIACAKVVRLHGNPQLAGRGIEGNNRIGVSKSNTVDHRSSFRAT